MRSVAAIMLITLMMLPCAWARAAAEPTTHPASDELIQLAFPEEVEVRILVEYVSKSLKTNILYDESVGRKKVTISAPTKIPRSSLMGLLESVLKMADLALVNADQPGWKKIVAAKDLLAVTEGVQREPDQVSNVQAGRIVSQVFPLKHSDTATVEPMIKPLLSKPGGNSFPIESQNLLVVTDYAANLRRISQMLELIDSPARKPVMQFVTVENLPATDLVREVSSLLREREGLSARQSGKRTVALTAIDRTNQIVVVAEEGAEVEAIRLIHELDVPSDAETRTYRFRYVSPERVEKIAVELTDAGQTHGQYKSAIDAETAMLIVTAPTHIHRRIAELKAELDVPQDDPQLSHIQFYKIMNTTADQVLATIQALEGEETSLAELARGMSEGPAAASKVTGPNLPPAGPGEPLPPPPAYTPSDEKSVEEAAAPEPAVRTAKTKDAMITVDPNTNSLIVVAPPDVQRIYKQLIQQLDKRRPQVMIEVTMVTLDTSEGFSLGVDLSHTGSVDDHEYLVFSSFGLSTIDPVTGALSIKPGVGFNGALIGPTTLNAVIRALSTSGHSKVVSAPRVLVNDNASATLTSVQEAPYTSINASDTVATTSFAGYESAGSTLTVTPHISEGDHLQLEYSITLNSFTGEGGEGVPPPRQTNTLDSEVTVPDGYAVVVGGLNRQDLSETASKIPLLGDIPYLGKIFSLTTDTDTESTLFVFIRPIILRDDQFEDLKYLSGRDLRLAQLPANFPSSESLIIE